MRGSIKGVLEGLGHGVWGTRGPFRQVIVGVGLRVLI